MVKRTQIVCVRLEVYMQLKKSTKIVSALLGLAVLAGCQHDRTAHVSTQANSVKPATTQVQRQQAAGAQAAAQQTVITVHLAQQQAEPSLVAVDLGGNSKLYALPQPILTQADMQQVTPVTAQNGQTFIMFEMNAQGRTKLNNVTRQAQGHYFLISAKGQLISVAQIAEPMSDGRLLISSNGAEHTQQILNLLR